MRSEFLDQDSRAPSSSQRCNDHGCGNAKVPPASDSRNTLAFELPAEYAGRGAVRTRVPTPQGILGWITQLANGCLEPLAKPDVELNGSKSVCVEYMKYLLMVQVLSTPPYAPNRFSSEWKTTCNKINRLIKICSPNYVRWNHQLLYIKITLTYQSRSSIVRSGDKSLGRLGRNFAR